MIGWFLAQQGSDVSDFAGQIQGLLIITGVVGIIWLGLMVVIGQRAAERRRRKREGLEPLPGIYTQVYRWVRQQLDPQGAAAAVAQSNVPLPAMDDLLVNLPTPDLDALTSDFPVRTGTAEFRVPETRYVVDKAAKSGSSPNMDDIIPGEIEPAYGAAPDDVVEVLRVWRDMVDGKLIIEMKGQFFSDVSEIQQAGLIQRFSKTLNELGRLGGQQPQAGIAPQAPPAAPKPLSPSNMAEDIEIILQKRLIGNPELIEHDLHVRPTSDGGVQIEVDGVFYEGVGDIEDAEIRAFIQAAIQEWERRR